MNFLHNQSDLCKASKRLYGAKAPPHHAGPRTCLASIPYGQDKKKDTPKSVSFFLVTAAQGRLHPSEIQMLGVGKAAPAQFFAALRIYAALAARPRRAVFWCLVIRCPKMDMLESMSFFFAVIP